MATIPDPHLIPAIPTESAIASARAFAGVAITLNIIAFFTFGGRIWTRCFPVFRLAMDDYVISIGYILVLADSIVLLLTVPFVFGEDPGLTTLADTEAANQHAVIAQPIWAWSMACIKVSVALMLLRLETSTPMRRFLWANIVIQCILATYNMIAQLLQCIPLRAAWDLLGVIQGAKCWSKDAIRINLICISTINILTDFIFAVIPISFLRKVQRPFRERAIIGVLMALGIFAGVASIIKAVAATRFGRTNDPTKEGIEIGMWSCIEELIGLISACVPCLRSPFQRVLQYFGLASTHAKTSYGRGYGQMYGESSNTKGQTRSRRVVEGGVGIKLKSMRSADAASEENILTGDDNTKDREIWCTTEVRMEEEQTRKTPEVRTQEQDGRDGYAEGWSDGSERSRSRSMMHSKT